MTLMTQMDCCTMLGISPKTLRNWLRHANMQFCAHPGDARFKCLTWEQVQQLATLHARPLQMVSSPSPAFLQDTTTLASYPENTEYTSNVHKSETALLSSLYSFSEEAELRKTVCSLQTKVLTLQEQLTQLAFELLHEHSERYEQRLNALEALLSQQTASSSSAQELTPALEQQSQSPCAPQRPLQSDELRTRSRILARIEYRASGFYMLICPQDGVLSFTTDSPQWFDWLASLTSFRFIGQQGRFTACRESLTRSWKAYRTFYGRSHKRSLGTTDCLTIAHLEHAAASLQSEMTSLS